MKKSEIMVGHTYSNGKSASGEVYREVLAFSKGGTDVKYKTTYAMCIPDDYGTFVCRIETFARWAKEDVS